MIKKFNKRWVTYLFILSLNGVTTKAEELTTIHYSVGSYYEVVIPSGISLDKDKSSLISIEAENTNIAPDKQVEISVAEGVNKNGEIDLLRENDTHHLQSEISIDGILITMDNNFVASFAGMDEELREVALLTIGKPEGSRKAGDYKAVLIFSVELITIDK